MKNIQNDYENERLTRKTTWTEADNQISYVEWYRTFSNCSVVIFDYYFVNIDFCIFVFAFLAFSIKQ